MTASSLSREGRSPKVTAFHLGVCLQVVELCSNAEKFLPLRLLSSSMRVLFVNLRWVGLEFERVGFVFSCGGVCDEFMRLLFNIHDRFCCVWMNKSRRMAYDCWTAAFDFFSSCLCVVVFLAICLSLLCFVPCPCYSRYARTAFENPGNG